MFDAGNDWWWAIDNIELLGLGGDPRDCNGDGVVDAGDLACVDTQDNLNSLLGDLGLLAGDLDGNGDVGFPDFLVLSANFGQAVGSYVDGDIDLSGTVEFPDFLTLSANFGKTASATAAAVPEPSSLMMVLLGVVGLMLRRRVGR